MAETMLCPHCKGIMKSCMYGIDNGQSHKLENKIYVHGGIYIGKTVYCPKCGTLAVCK